MKIIDLLKLHRLYEAQTDYIDALEIYEAILNTHVGDVVEIGSACGGTTIVMIEAAKQVGKMVYSIDPYPEQYENVADSYTPGLMTKFKERFQNNIIAKETNIVQFNDDLKDCIDRLPDKLSVIFIDGVHEFYFVKAEYEMLKDKVVPGGVIFIHDIQAEYGQLSHSVGGGVKNVLSWGVGEKISNFMLKITI